MTLRNGEIRRYVTSQAAHISSVCLDRNIFLGPSFSNTSSALKVRNDTHQATKLLKMAVFWDISPCSLVGVHRRFRGAYCLHHQCDRRKTLFLTLVFQISIRPANRINFCNWFLQSVHDGEIDPHWTSFSDEAWFHLLFIIIISVAQQS
jgi:hypothetical protein